MKEDDRVVERLEEMERSGQSEAACLAEFLHDQIKYAPLGEKPTVADLVSMAEMFMDYAQEFIREFGTARGTTDQDFVDLVARLTRPMAPRCIECGEELPELAEGHDSVTCRECGTLQGNEECGSFSVNYDAEVEALDNLIVQAREIRDHREGRA